MELQNKRQLDPFFIDAVNLVYQKPNKKAFIMDGTIGVGKSTNFTFDAPYDVASHVKPVDESGSMVRRSTWVIARESENSAVNTLYEIFEHSRFPPAILYKKDGPVKKYGINPTKIVINHGLSDGTELHMTIECYGFRDDKSLGRLKSRSFLGGMAPEMQTMPFDIIELLIERCGGRSSPGLIVQKKINGKMHTLSGADPLTMVFGDMNIPPRPHKVYDEFYDNTEIEQSEYEIVTPPSPIIHKPISQATPTEKKLYKTRKFENKQVVWVPNPDVYFMTKHYEEAVLDDAGNPVEENGEVKTVPWSGYDYWLTKTSNDDSYIRRLLLGVPDTIGGAAAVYHNFNRNTHLAYDNYVRGIPVYVGLDPGISAGWAFFQVLSNGRRIHAFKEFVFSPEDGMHSRQQIENFIAPYIESLAKHDVEVIGDPYALVKTSKGDGEVSILREHGIKTKNCVVSNQDTDARISNLGYFITTGMLTVHPEECPMLVKALSGGYQRIKSSSGVISSRINKDNPYSHIAEAAQYAAANLYKKLVKRNARRPTKVSKFVSA